MSADNEKKMCIRCKVNHRFGSSRFCDDCRIVRIYEAQTNNGHYNTGEWHRTRKKVMARDGYKCYCCDRNRTQTPLLVHHIVPIAFGGTDDLDNLVTLCHTCHRLIHKDDLKVRYEH